MNSVFYAGHLRPFRHVGSHPQFEHIHDPPLGYEFTTAGKVGSTSYARVIKSAATLARDALANGSTYRDLSRFIWSRYPRAQARVPDVKLAFLPSTPFILGQVPWVIEIEDTTTLFAPFPRINGKRVYPRLLGLDGVYDSGFFPAVKALVESESCRGIICHVRSTAESIPLLFHNPKLAEKVSHIPLGVRGAADTKRRASDGKVTLLFTNSWHQGATSFYLRGGLDVLEAYSRIYSKRANVHLIIRSALPDDLEPRYRKIISDCNVEVIDKFLGSDQMESLFGRADIYVLPSARLHVVSILQAMSRGLALIASDGWGIAEYVEHNRNGLIVPGRYGKACWLDDGGMLQEHFPVMFSTDTALANRLEETLLRLIEDEHLRLSLGQAAKKDVETKYSLESWNRGLAKAFDRALA